MVSNQSRFTSLPIWTPVGAGLQVSVRRAIGVVLAFSNPLHIAPCCQRCIFRSIPDGAVPDSKLWELFIGLVSLPNEIHISDICRFDLDQTRQLINLLRHAGVNG